MATVVQVLPKSGSKKFRDGCTKHWQVRPNPAEVRLGVRKATFCKQGPAAARAGEIRDKIHRGVYVATDDKTTVAEMAEKWYQGAVGRRLRPETQRRYHNVCYRQIGRSAMAHMPVTAVRPDDVRAWVAQMQEQDLAASTIYQNVAFFRLMIWQRINDGHPLPRGNPVPHGVAREPGRRENDPLTVAEVQAWRDALPEDMRPMLDLEAWTGARMSEVLGLREEDIVWTGRDMSAPLADQLRDLAELPPERYRERAVHVKIQRQLERRRFADGKAVAAPLKNARARRVVPLPQSTVRVLGDALTKYPPLEGGWLFGARRGPGGRPARAPRPWEHSVYMRALKTAAAEAGLSLPHGQCSHALRHHCVSVLRDQGFNDQQIADWIGDSMMTVLKTYGRPMPDSLPRMAAALEAAYAVDRPALRLVGDA